MALTRPPEKAYFGLDGERFFLDDRMGRKGTIQITGWYLFVA